METKKIFPEVNGNEKENRNAIASSEKSEKYGMGRTAAASSLGGTIGGAAGVALGSIIAQEVSAHETVEVPIVEPEPIKPEPTRPQRVETEPEKPVVTEEPDKPVEPVNPPTPEPETETEVQVIGYEASRTEDGHVIQEAVVSIDGNVVHYADVTDDDIIDLVAVDINDDGEISQDEIVDISDAGLSMQPLREAYMETQAIAQNTDINEPDYINDANVDDYNMV